MSSGTVMVGGVVSCTVTVNDAVPVLPAASVAVHVTVVVVPIENIEPDSGVQVTPTGPSTLSSADTSYRTTAPSALVASSVISSGTVITGVVVSGSLQLISDSALQISFPTYPC